MPFRTEKIPVLMPTPIAIVTTAAIVKPRLAPKRRAAWRRSLTRFISMVPPGIARQSIGKRPANPRRTDKLLIRQGDWPSNAGRHASRASAIGRGVSFPGPDFPGAGVAGQIGTLHLRAIPINADGFRKLPHKSRSVYESWI